MQLLREIPDQIVLGFHLHLQMRNRLLLSLKDRFALFHRLAVDGRIVEAEKLAHHRRLPHFCVAQNRVDERLQPGDARVEKSRAEVVAEPFLLRQAEIHVGEHRLELRVEPGKVGEAAQHQPEVVLLVVLDAKLENLRKRT